MKLDKTLLQAMFIGASIAAVSSCSLQETVDPKAEQCDEQCVLEGHSNHGNENDGTYNCPACGLG